MGSVWEAEHVRTRRRVAIKILYPRTRDGADWDRRVIREAKAASAVRHYGVVPVLDVLATDDGGYGLVMDRLVGRTLRDYLDAHGPLDVRTTCRILLPAARAVAAAHRAGVLHRDLKPQNLFVEDDTPDGAATATTKVLDFGIAAALDASASWTEGDPLTESGAVLGTPAYMAPEQLLGERALGVATDVWAFGTILYECLAGRRPVDGSNFREILQGLSRRDIVPVSERARGVPRELSDLVTSMLEPNVERRLSSMDRALDVLKRHAHTAVGAAASEAFADDPHHPRKALLYGALAATTLLLAWPRDLPGRRDAVHAGAGTLPGAAAYDAGPSVVVDARTSIELSIATLTPKRSPWTRLFDVWRRAVDRRTEGRVQIRIQAAGAHFFHGSEASLLSRLRIGQLDGAALSSLSLAKIHPSVLALQVPGVIDTWDKLDRAREALGPDLVDAFREEGFELAAWGDVGQARILSRKTPIERPRDLLQRRVAVMESDPLAPILLSLVPGAIPVPLGITDILPALRRNSVGASVTALAAPAWVAEQHQWANSLDYITVLPLACTTGALVIKQSRLDSVGDEDRQALLELARRIEPEVSARVRRLDAQSAAHLERKLTPVVPTLAHRAEWRALFDRAAERFSHGILPVSLLDRARSAADGAE